jgi:hypothetical protein
VRFWLKLLGKSGWELDDFWTRQSPELLRYVRFSEQRDPTGVVHKGDKLVYYAVGWKAICAIARVTADLPYEKPEVGEEQWPLALDVFVEKKVGQLKNAPSADVLQLTDDQRQDMVQGSFVELRNDQYERAAEAL